MTTNLRTFGYTIASLALALLLLLVIPYHVYKDIEAQQLNPEGLTIGPSLRWYVDHGEASSPEQVLSAEPSFFQPFDGHTWLRQSLAAEPVWLAFDVNWHPLEPESLELFVDLGFATLNDVKFYLWDTEKGIVSEQQSGDHLSMSERAAPLSHPLFRSVLSAYSTQTVVLRIETDSFLNTPIVASSGLQSIVRTQHLGFLLGIFYGCIGLIFFYNVFILMMTRRKSYFYYVLYLLFLMLYQGVMDGVVGQYLYSEPGWLLDRGVVYFAGLANLMALLFVRTILRLEFYAPVLNRWVGHCILFLGLSFVVEVVYPSNFSSLWMMATISFFCLLLPVIGLVAWRRGSPLARSYFLAWMSYPILVLVYVLCMSGVIPTTYDTLNSLRVGAMVQAFLMSFALAYYIRELRMHKSKLRKAYYEDLELQLDSLSETTKSLTKGWYNSRSRIDADARLGSLSGDINTLAQTLKKSKEDRENWLADISHELRTPLTVFRGTLESMHDGVIPMEPEALKGLIAESERMARLVDELHELSLLESHSITLNYRQCDVLSLINTLLNSAERHRHQSGFEVDIVCEHTCLMYMVDRDRLSQVLINLLSNTLKYSQAPIRLKVELKACEEGLTIIWSDSAPGVSSEELTQLFDRLYRTESSRSRQSGGAGLGLTLSAAIVRAMQGSISARHSDLGGLSIVMFLPRICSEKNIS